MAHTLCLEVIVDGLTVFTTEVGGPVELGRQKRAEPEPYCLLHGNAAGPARLLIAHNHEDNFSREHVLLEVTTGGVRITNSSRVPLEIDCGPPLPAPPSGDHSAVYRLPFTLQLANRAVRVAQGAGFDSDDLCSLEGVTIGPGNLREANASTYQSRGPASNKAVDALVGSLQTTLGVLQSTIGSVDFLEKAVEAMITIVGLDTGRALRFDEGASWSVLAAAPTPNPGWEPSQRILERVRNEKRTVWQEPKPGSDSLSLHTIQALLAAPLLAPDGRVLGVLYGERHWHGNSEPRPISKLEALLVDLLASGVSTGMARQQHERAALEARVRFEQFFTPELARHLARDAKMLDGKTAEVTLLFVDIRGFSRISEKLPPVDTVHWIGALMDTLSRLVFAEGGVVVDYIGDEMFAMWGAPQTQTDHAERAVRAALAMTEALPGLSAHWARILGSSFDLGIGLNSGPAHVGNTGSESKFKYGPLGNEVNLASRVQGLTKYLKCRLLVTEATRRGLGPGFIARRVCRVRVVNISAPVNLYEVEKAGDAGRLAFFQESERVLDALEKKDFHWAAGHAGALLQEHPADGPLRLTLFRATQQLVNEEADFDPVWVPPGK